jgi:hypothetical protein
MISVETTEGFAHSILDAATRTVAVVNSVPACGGEHRFLT